MSLVNGLGEVEIVFEQIVRMNFYFKKKESVKMK